MLLSLVCLFSLAGYSSFERESMTINELIQELQDMKSICKIPGNAEVLITDGYNCKGYQGNFLVQKWIEPGSKKVYVDIGIGGLDGEIKE